MGGSKSDYIVSRKSPGSPRRSASCRAVTSILYPLHGTPVDLVVPAGRLQIAVALAAGDSMGSVHLPPQLASALMAWMGR